jgi:raffinose/stachyose/melibiose transport system substrate-binding protein
VKKILICAAVFIAALIFSLPVFLTRGHGPEPAGAPKITKLSVFSYKTCGRDDDALDELLSRFTQEYPQIKIAYDAADSEGEYSAVLKEKVKSGGLDDVFAYLRTMNSLQGTAEDLSEQDFSMGLPYSIQRLVSQHGRIFSFPLELGTCGLFVNMSILREHGIESEPKNYREFINDCTRLAYDNVVPIDADSSSIAPAPEMIAAARALAPLYAKGRPDFTPYAEGRKSFGELLKPGLKTVHELSKRGFWRPRDILNAASCRATVSDFASGTVPFAFGGTWQLAAIKELDPKFDFMFIPLPLADDNSVLLLRTVLSFGVSAQSKNKDAALNFLRYTAEPSRMKEYAEKRVSLDPYKIERSSAPLLKNITDAIKNGAVVCCDTGDDFAWDLAPVIARAANIAAGGGSVEDAMAAADSMQLARLTQ